MEKYRHELKYLINEGDAELLKERLELLLEKDPYTVNGEYFIRSLYFDDYYHSAYDTKMMGVSERKKYRIRLYNNDTSFIRLERKSKVGAYIYKTGMNLTADQAERIMDGDYDFLLHHNDLLARQFYVECMSNVMRPMVYVDYEREPYILDAGTVRITFDRNVRAAYPTPDLVGDKTTYYVLEPGKLVLEVKFTEFLPKIIKEVLPPRSAEMTSVSKFTLCCEKINYLFAYENEQP